MPVLPESRIAELLEPYLFGVTAPELLYSRLSDYLDLLVRWNARTNLTAIREPEEIVRRHFGESLFAGSRLRPYLPSGSTLLDFGSGAGFPGIPIQLLMPDLSCCLAESQGKKASFLREAVRALILPTEIWSARAESMPKDHQFHCVIMRAVDNMEMAVSAAASRIAPDGFLGLLGSGANTLHVPLRTSLFEQFAVPGGHSRVFYLYRQR